MSPSTAFGLGNVIILGSFDTVNVPYSAYYYRSGWYPGDAALAVISDTL